MSTNAPPTDLPSHSFSCAEDFEAFLDREHTTAPGFYLKLAKKASGILSLSAAEAVEVGLCFGWIDGWGKTIDKDWWFVRYTPRRAKSIWSQKNVNTVGRLQEEGKMRPAGIAAVEAAKADGRWDRAYAGPATITVPEDFAVALTAEPAAASFFEGLGSMDRYAVLWRLQTSSVKGRAKKMEALVQMLAEGKNPHQPGKPAAKSKHITDTQKAASRKAVVKQAPVRRKKQGSPKATPNDPISRPRRAGLRSRP